MAHGAAHDPAQDVAAALVGGRDAVGDQEAGRAQVVGDDAVRGRGRAFRLHARGVFGRRDQGAEEIGLIVRLHALHDGGHAFQAHAGVDLRLGQRALGPVLEPLELHEDEVPELQEPVAVLIGTARGPAGQLRALVDKDLGARTAGTGVAHRPEVVRRRDADDAVVGEAGDLLPEVRRLVVGMEDRDEQLVLRQPELLGDQGPGGFDRAFLEIIAEGEIPQHLEEGVVAGGVADIVQVVMLAAGAHAFLARRRGLVRTGFEPGEDILERHHAGVDEHQRRIVLRHQRRRGDDQVVLALEVVEEGAADLIEARHGLHIGRRSRAAQGTFRRRLRELPPAAKEKDAPASQGVLLRRCGAALGSRFGPGACVGGDARSGAVATPRGGKPWRAAP